MQDALGLEKMAAFVADNDFEAGADGEAHSGEERIPKANAVDVLVPRAKQKLAAGFVSCEKALENRSADMRSGPDLRRSASALGLRRWLDEAADKPAREPSGGNLFDWRIRLLIQHRRNSRQIGFIRDAEVLETLAHTPTARGRLPIQLCFGESSDELPGGLVVGVEARGKLCGPSGNTHLLRRSHGTDYMRTGMTTGARKKVGQVSKWSSGKRRVARTKRKCDVVDRGGAVLYVETQVRKGWVKVN